MAPTANKEIPQILTFLHEVVPAVPAEKQAFNSVEVLVCFRVKGFGARGLPRHTVSPLSSLGPPALSVLHHAGGRRDAGYQWSVPPVASRLSGFGSPASGLCQG